MAFRSRPTYKDRHARISSGPGDPLQLKAGYIDADFLHPTTFPLQSDGGPYIFVSYPVWEPQISGGAGQPGVPKGSRRNTDATTLVEHLKP
jgi:hypothetical protein